MRNKLKTEQEAKLYIAQNMIFFISIYVSIGFVLYFILGHLYKAKPLRDSIIFLLIISLFWWGFYIWFKEFKNNEKNTVKEHIYSFLTLILFYFLEWTSPLGGEVEWVFLLFYPFIICCIYNGKVYFYWSLIYLVTFILYQGHIFSKFGTETYVVFELFSRVFYCMFAILLGYFIFYVLKALSIRFGNYQIQQQKERMFQTLNRFVPVVESRYHRNRNEIKQMSQLIEKMGRYFPEENIQVWECNLAALVHYVMPIYIPDYLYEKKEMLTVQERDLIKNQVKFAADLLSDMEEFERVQLGILYHCEHVNGQGYPFQLKGEQVPIFAQIIGVVDKFMQMTNYRINQEKQYTIEETMAILSSLPQVVYEEKIILAFEEVVKEVYKTHPKV